MSEQLLRDVVPSDARLIMQFDETIFWCPKCHKMYVDKLTYDSFSKIDDFSRVLVCSNCVLDKIEDETLILLDGA